ncbi:MAG: penicillin-binding protein 2, partial [Acidobacteriales bacterium]|nr:penicillin-binding protein 2 [Terriglobales bacterium]
MANTSLNPVQKRLYLLTGLLVLWMVVICGRLVYLQVFCYGDFVVRAQRQQQRTIEVAPRRGLIYDRNGQALAMSVSVDSVFAVPSEIPDKVTTASLLSKILKVDPQELVTRMKSSHAFCWIARKLNPEVSARIRALNLKGIYFQKESKRFYPKQELAAQTLGFVGLDDEGLGGLERAYEPKLRGKPGKVLISMDARRRWFGRVERQPEAGENLVLTIDEKIQYIAERELDAAVRQTRSAAGTVIVQNPRTGEILALANRPTFNANAFHRSDPRTMKNRAVTDIYEPGSTFKIVTIAGALEERLTTPGEVIDCQMGSITIGGLRIRDHKPFGLLNVTQVMAESSDVGAIKLGLRLGEERFDHYIRSFGFGKQTGIELPGETRGLTKPASRWSKVSIGAISMGQEIGISSLQLVSMISTIANDGIYTPTRVVAGTTAPLRDIAGSNASGGVRTQRVVFRPTDERRVISTLTAVQMKKMLESVVLFGTGKKAILEGYRSAGKTGTAQKIDPATGAYSRTNHIASFAGFAPLNEPAITVAIILDSPVGPYHGGDVAAPVFARVAQQVLSYMNVPHDAELTNSRRLLLRAAATTSAEETADASPDRLGGMLEMAAEKPATTPEPPL